MRKLSLYVLWICSLTLSATNPVWNPDLDGKYKNPIVHADYSDPDVLRVGDDYYMTASSFGHIPGLPILHSRDLVNWKLVGHAIQQYPDAQIGIPQHGNAVWAPSIRFHEGEFYIYYGDPDRGVFMTKTKNPAGVWSPLKLVQKAKGWIDCCPLWDENGKAYIVHAYAKSRSGIKSKLAVVEMSWAGDTIIGKDSIIFDGTDTHPTLEGPKFYKRNGKYYILAPAGGVKPGWQEAFRSESVYGPYEYKTVLEQGSTNINGPHQGGWVTTQTGEDWFIHFQDRYAYGRLVHLNPVKWVKDWPEMGVDYDGNGIGEPVSVFKMPDIGDVKTEKTQPETTDEFVGNYGLQWQWQSNYDPNWAKVDKKGWLNLRAVQVSPDLKNIWTVGSLLLQKFPAPVFTSETCLDISGLKDKNQAGLVIFSYNVNQLAVRKSGSSVTIEHIQAVDANSGKPEKLIVSQSIRSKKVYLRVSVYPSNPTEIVPVVMGKFSYSLDGKSYTAFGNDFEIKEAHWVGAKMGIYALSTVPGKGIAKFDYFRVTK